MTVGSLVEDLSCYDDAFDEVVVRVPDAKAKGGFRWCDIETVEKIGDGLFEIVVVNTEGKA